jgi:hypothetical protein
VAAAPATPANAPRPLSAEGTFLRIVMCNDVYTLANYPHVATAVKHAKE